MTWLKSLDRHEVAYWIGLAMLFLGLGVAVSIATALIVTGGILVVTSFASSFFVTWLSARESA